MSKYVLIHNYVGCPCCDDDPDTTEVTYYDTYEEACKDAWGDDVVAQVIERSK